MALASKGRAFIRAREQASRKRLRLTTLIIFSAVASLLVLAPLRIDPSLAPSRNDGGAFSGVLSGSRADAVKVGSAAWNQAMKSLQELRGVSEGGRDVGVGAAIGEMDKSHDPVGKGEAPIGVVDKDLVAEGDAAKEGNPERPSLANAATADITAADDAVKATAPEGEYVVERDLMSALDEKTRGDKATERGSMPQESGECLKHIIYDKPVKTGSTAVTVALQDFLKGRGEGFVQCTFETCGEAAREVCEGKRPKIHFVEHISPEEGLLDCLKRMGYYRVTSVREPLDRWESAFLYNRKKKAMHYGIGHNESYANFMALYPDCSLFDYYDGLGKRCEEGKIGVEERIQRVVGKYEEIIDLYHDDHKGQLHRLLSEGLKEENKSPRPDGDFRQWFDKRRLEPEIRLYKAFKARQRELVGKEPRLC